MEHLSTCTNNKNTDSFPHEGNEHNTTNRCVDSDANNDSNSNDTSSDNNNNDNDCKMDNECENHDKIVEKNIQYSQIDILQREIDELQQTDKYHNDLIAKLTQENYQKDETIDSLQKCIYEMADKLNDLLARVNSIENKQNCKDAPSVISSLSPPPPHASAILHNKSDNQNDQNVTPNAATTRPRRSKSLLDFYDGDYKQSLSPNYLNNNNDMDIEDPNDNDNNDATPVFLRTQSNIDFNIKKNQLQNNISKFCNNSNQLKTNEPYMFLWSGSLDTSSIQYNKIEAVNMLDVVNSLCNNSFGSHYRKFRLNIHDGNNHIIHNTNKSNITMNDKWNIWNGGIVCCKNVHIPTLIYQKYHNSFKKCHIISNNDENNNDNNMNDNHPAIINRNSNPLPKKNNLISFTKHKKNICKLDSKYCIIFRSGGKYFDNKEKDYHISRNCDFILFNLNSISQKHQSSNTDHHYFHNPNNISSNNNPNKSNDININVNDNSEKNINFGSQNQITKQLNLKNNNIENKGNLSCDNCDLLDAYYYELPKLNLRREGCQCIYSNIHGLIVVGGFASLKKNTIYYSSCEQLLLNENSNSWKWQMFQNNMNEKHGRKHPSICWLNENRLFVIGGYNINDRYLNTCEIYVFGEKHWVNIQSCHHRRNCSGILNSELLQRVFIAGGYDNDYKANKSAEYYDYNKNNWYQLPSMNYQHYEYPCLFTDDTQPFNIFVSGDRSDNSVSSLGCIEYYDIRDSSNKWNILCDYNDNNASNNNNNNPLTIQKIFHLNTINPNIGWKSRALFM